MRRIFIHRLWNRWEFFLEAKFLSIYCQEFRSILKPFYFKVYKFFISKQNKCILVFNFNNSKFCNDYKVIVNITNKFSPILYNKKVDAKSSSIVIIIRLRFINIAWIIRNGPIRFLSIRLWWWRKWLIIR